MTYSPTTNPARLTGQSIGGRRREWVYESADSATTVRAAGYISNASQLGMKVGDPVLVIDTATPLHTQHQVIAITAGAADLGDATTVGTNTNT